MHKTNIHLKNHSKLTTLVYLLLIFNLAVITTGLLIVYQVKGVDFSYSSITCANQLTFLPDNQSVVGSKDFSVSFKDFISIGRLNLISRKTCFKSNISPSYGVYEVKVAPSGIGILAKTYSINISEAPKLLAQKIDQPLAAMKNFDLKLTAQDSLYDYKIESNGKFADCVAKNSQLSCDIASLNLDSGKDYSVKLVRLFDGKPVATLIDQTITTLSAATLKKSSIESGQTIYDNTQDFSFSFDKEITSADIKVYKIVGESQNLVESKASVTKNLVNLNVAKAFDRNTDYRIVFNKLVASDGSGLDQMIKIDFKVSGGPKVISIDADPTTQPLSQTLTLSFDQPLSTSQSVLRYVSVDGVSASIWKSGSKVYVAYTGAPLCKNIRITVNSGLQSTYGIAQTESWSFTTRTICYITSTIGYSVKGRAILAYTFGSGTSTILFTGGIHGDEPSGSSIMYDWINYLDQNYYTIPSGKKIVIVPAVNPDGLANNSRYNANNVNLDRNFPTANWTANIETKSGVIINGGGLVSLSEPEAVALANLTSSLQPKFEVSFHAQGSLVGANQVGNSVSLANIYLSGVGYRSMVGQADAVMGYTLTGEYEDWMGEKLGIPAILIELPSLKGSYFSAHQSTLWRMINL